MKTNKKKNNRLSDEAGHGVPVRIHHVLRGSPATQSRFRRVGDLPAPPSGAHEAMDGTACCALKNEFGFWELTFKGQHAVLRQHPALFLVAYLVTNPARGPMTAVKLVSEICDRFSDHPDFPGAMPLFRRPRDPGDGAKALLKKQQALEAIVDREDEIDPLRAEALRQLEAVYELQSAESAHAAEEAEAKAVATLRLLLDLYATLANALDARGCPQRCVRAFARHLLLYLIMPGIRAGIRARQEALPEAIEVQGRGLLFTYEPPLGVNWSDWEFDLLAC